MQKWQDTNYTRGLQFEIWPALGMLKYRLAVNIWEEITADWRRL